MKHNSNKKVLRERKRHTACRVARARFADWLGVGGRMGVPLVLTWGGGGGGLPPSSSWMGVPHPADPFRRGMGYPLSRPGMGYPPPHPDLGWGTPLSRPGTGYPPPSSRKCEQTENITFPHPSDASGNYGNSAERA